VRAVELTPDDNGTLLVTVPDLPEAITFGEDREQALARAVDAIESALMGAMAAREP
jgi:antitoxin HicB